jgi:hypothetical protein
MSHFLELPFFDELWQWILKTLNFLIFIAFFIFFLAFPLRRWHSPLFVNLSDLERNFYFVLVLVFVHGSKYFLNDSVN